jgi:hypothetical protein
VPETVRSPEIVVAELLVISVPSSLMYGRVVDRAPDDDAVVGISAEMYSESDSFQIDAGPTEPKGSLGVRRSIGWLRRVFTSKKEICD